jgi:hypothetical protein
MRADAYRESEEEQPETAAVVEDDFEMPSSAEEDTIDDVMFMSFDLHDDPATAATPSVANAASAGAGAGEGSISALNLTTNTTNTANTARTTPLHVLPRPVAHNFDSESQNLSIQIPNDGTRVKFIVQCTVARLLR